MTTGDYGRTDLTVVEQCKQVCMDDFEVRAAVDFCDGQCFVHYKDSFETGNVIKKIGATQYLTILCKVR